MIDLFFTEPPGMKAPAEEDRLKRFSVALKFFRNKSGLSQKALAMAVDVDVKTITRMENGQMVPNLGIIWRLAAVLDQPVPAILGEPTPTHEAASAPADRPEAVSHPLAEDRLDRLESDLHEMGELVRQLQARADQSKAKRKASRSA